MDQSLQYIVPAIAAMTAIILLAAGGRLLKPAIGLSGGLLGAGFGLLIAPSLSGGISPLIIALICGIIAAVIAIYIAKIVILLTLAVSFAVIFPVITWQIAGLGDGAQVVEGVVAAMTTPTDQEEQIDEQNEEQNESAGFELTTEGALTDAFSILTGDAVKVIKVGIQRANTAWEVIPTGSRLMLIGAAIAGLLLGLLVATFMPFIASAMVTSVAGSVLLIEAIRNCITLIWSQQAMSSISPTVLIVILTCIAVAGFGLQMTLRRRASRSAPIVE